MKTHTSEFKQKISEFGRQLNSIITYQENGQTITLTSEDLFSVTPHYEGGILKSVMKVLDVNSMIDIPLETEINYQLGVKVRETPTDEDDDMYDYVDFGNYIVYSSERQEDMGSYKLTCYDKMLYSMKDYLTPTTDSSHETQITYPITIRNYLSAICNQLNIDFANASDTFTHYDKEIPNELFLDENGNDLGYTFRDVLDQIAQVTASTICINADDELEVRYITDTEDEIDEEYLKDINVNFGEKYGKVNSIVLSRSGGSDSIYAQDAESIAENGLCEIRIEDNQFMNGNDRDEYLDGLLTALDGLEYYINDFTSTGICYYDLCDRYSVSIGENTYSCVMLNDEVLITQGLEENIHTDMPEESETDYKKSDTTDRRINQAYIIVNKQNQSIEALTSKTQQIDTEVNNNYQDLLDKFSGVATLDDIDSITNQVQQIQTDTYTKTEIQQIANGTGADGIKVSALVSTSATFDEDGMHYAKTGASTATTINQVGMEVDSTGDTTEELLFAGYDETQQEALVRVANLYLTRYLGLADWRIEEIEDSTYGQGVGFFYLK